MDGEAEVVGVYDNHAKVVVKAKTIKLDENKKLIKTFTLPNAEYFYVEFVKAVLGKWKEHDDEASFREDVIGKKFICDVKKQVGTDGKDYYNMTNFRPHPEQAV